MSVIDNYYGSNDGGQALYSGGYTAAGQSFTGDGNPLTHCNFLIGKIGSPTGTAVCKLYAHSGTYGTDSVPTGAALPSSETFDVSTIVVAPIPSRISVKFPTPYTTVNGTYYVITLEYSGGDASNYIMMRYDSTSPAHAGNACRYGVSWGAGNTVDGLFSCESFVGVKVRSNGAVAQTTGTSLSPSIPTGVQVGRSKT